MDTRPDQLKEKRMCGTGGSWADVGNEVEIIPDRIVPNLILPLGRSRRARVQSTARSSLWVDDDCTDQIEFSMHDLKG